MHSFICFNFTEHFNVNICCYFEWIRNVSYNEVYASFQCSLSTLNTKLVCNAIYLQPVRHFIVMWSRTNEINEAGLPTMMQQN